MTGNAVLEHLRHKPFKCLNDGHVILLDIMGDEHDVAQAARTSYGQGTKSVSDDTQLLRYLLRHIHTTPYEMAVLKFHLRVPMDCWRQWIRHRMSSVNEYSTRYSEAIDSCQITEPDEWRLQATNNKQGSSGFLPVDGPEEAGMSTGLSLTADEKFLHEQSQRVYRTRLRAGISREQARKDLPLSTYTEAVWKIDLHNLMHFLNLRMSAHAQKEIREYATTIGEQIVKPLYPNVWRAFVDFRLQSISLSRLDQIVCREVHDQFRRGTQTFDIAFENAIDTLSFQSDFAGWDRSKKCRERDECRDKLSRLLGFSE